MISFPALRLPTLPSLSSTLRSLSLCLGLFSAANFVGAFAIPRFDATVWWLDLPSLPSWLTFTIVASITAALLFHALDMVSRRSVRRFSLVWLGLGALLALWNSIWFLVLVLRGSLDSGFPLPFSLSILLAFAFAFTDVAQRRDREMSSSLSPLIFLGSAFTLPLLQMLCFGMSDYSRSADAIVVFGARAYADGRVSVTLGDRVRTACRLYHDGYAPRLIFSGGPADGSMHETEAMRRLALSLGVPDSAIVLDRDGVSTTATAFNCRIIFDQLGVRRAIAVSNFYHLPRIKLAFQRQGIDVYTVPAEESGAFSGTPWQLFREAAGLGIYYLAPLWEPARPRLPSSFTIDSPAFLS